MDNKKFQKRKENFKCEKCGTFVEGDGYTNHCPNCLWSKHVDINPGDRKADCKGMMEPVQVLTSGGKHVIVHECKKCGKVMKNKAASDDSIDKIIEISTMPKGGDYNEG